MSLDTAELELATAYDNASAIRVSLEKKIESNHTTFLPDSALQQDKADTDKATAQLAALVAKARADFDTHIEGEQARLNLDYGADMTADIGAELDQIEKSGVTRDELGMYLKKYKDNKLALRRLSAMAKAKGYAVTGATYDSLVYLLGTIKHDGQQIIDALPTAQGDGTGMVARIGLNLMAEHVVRYDNLKDAPFMVVDGKIAASVFNETHKPEA
ncbi:hypothetical protein [Lacticaseibacillus daqingensis]|uniref:hypothetical protein n=1 Tax=Lacticaseibacillus daqingensis TaxID=2486014 RepID=UPI000F789F12|nr:hypothetical protein [Lacticaseibacillus daqingensis]